MIFEEALSLPSSADSYVGYIPLLCGSFSIHYPQPFLFFFFFGHFVLKTDPAPRLEEFLLNGPFDLNMPTVLLLYHPFQRLYIRSNSASDLVELTRRILRDPSKHLRQYLLVAIGLFNLMALRDHYSFIHRAKPKTSDFTIAEV